MENIIIYGVNSLQTKKTFEYLTQMGKNVVAFADGNPELWGKQFFGVKCIGPDDLPMEGTDVVVAAYGRNSPRIVSEMNRRGVDWFTISQMVLNCEEAQFRELYSLLSDTLSAQTMSTLTASRCNLQFDEHGLIMRPQREQYFGFWNIEAPDMVFADIGAYAGENTEDYLFFNKGARKIYAFEPIHRLYRALKTRCDRLTQEWALDPDCIVCVNAGLGKTNGTASFVNHYSGMTSFAQASDHGDTQIVSLDSFLQGARIDFLKADIEGAEMDMLRGAEQTIRQYKPKLAVSIYHSIWDFYQIPLYVKSLVPEYHLAIRHYSSCDAETVLYAWR
jgi:FkbM family methyltransferase